MWYKLLFRIIPDEGNATCVAIGQDPSKNETISVFVEETRENCHSHNICYKLVSKYVCGVSKLYCYQNSFLINTIISLNSYYHYEYLVI